VRALAGAALAGAALAGAAGGIALAKDADDGTTNGGIAMIIDTFGPRWSGALLVGLLLAACGGAGLHGDEEARRQASAPSSTAGEAGVVTPPGAGDGRTRAATEAPPEAKAEPVSGERPSLVDLAATVGFDGVARVDVAMAHRLVTERSILVLDVRAADTYAVAHLPGAQSLPLDELSVSALPADTDTPILTYCT
jgi:hypothetical protein